MAGLLDMFNSDDGMQAMGLLAAAAPSMAPQNFAGRLAQAGQNYNALQMGQTDRGLKKAQLDEALQKTALEKFSLQRLQDWQKLLMGNGSEPSAGQTQVAPMPQGSAPAMTPQSSMGPPAEPQPLSLGSGGGQPMPNAPQAQPRAGFPFALPGLGDMQSRAIAGSMNPSEYMKMYADKAAPQTDITKLMATQGIDPKSPLGQMLVQQAIAKANYIAPVSGRPGGYLRDANGTMTQLPHVPDGFTAVQGMDGQFHMVPVDGGLAAMQQSAGATALGKAGAEPTTAYSGNIPIFSTKAQDVGRATGNPAPGSGLPANDARAGAREIASMQASLPNIKDPASRAMVQEEIARLQGQSATYGTPSIATPVPQMGAVEGAKLSQDELSNKGKSLMADSSQAQTVISRLQNIKMLAPGAITGAESSRRDFFNGLLSLGGIKGAEDAKTASDLVDKNSAQIVSALRLGAGGGGTDALQSLLSSGNPNRKMTVHAINDAVDQLIASQKMTQAKMQLLQPHYLGRDPVAYGTKENTFDQNADPRIWQLEGLKGQAQADYIRSLPPEVASEMISKRKALKDLGVLK